MLNKKQAPLDRRTIYRRASILSATAHHCTPRPRPSPSARTAQWELFSDAAYFMPLPGRRGG